MTDASDDALPPAARAAWEAYQRMLASKTAHFDFLSELDRKAQQGGQRTLAEIARLETLLSAHTAAVRAFRECVSELAAADPAARDALLAHLHLVNAPLGASDPAALH